MYKFIRGAEEINSNSGFSFIKKLLDGNASAIEHRKSTKGIKGMHGIEGMANLSSPFFKFAIPSIPCIPFIPSLKFAIISFTC